MNDPSLSRPSGRESETPDHDNVRGAEVVIPCSDVDGALAVFASVGFELDSIYPADEPAVAVLVGHGVRLRLERGSGSGVVVRVTCRDPRLVAGGATELVVPGGARIELVGERPAFELPALRPSFVITRATNADAWRTGRAGMQYRDLIPDRQGGRFIASHIRIVDGGLVPDYVHFHAIRLQMIYCHRGWVRVIYEDQGDSFVMHAGDCVLQPPRIRHRVLECSPGLEVIELGCPAVHETRADRELALPTAGLRLDRDFDGQRFVRHQAAAASWTARRGFEERELGIEAATHGMASAKVVRRSGGGEACETRDAETHDGELWFGFVLQGALTLACEGEHRLGAGDAFVVPPRRPFALVEPSTDLERLEVHVAS